jgi:hypothetical protein
MHFAPHQLNFVLADDYVAHLHPPFFDKKKQSPPPFFVKKRRKRGRQSGAKERTNNSIRLQNCVKKFLFSQLF